MLTYIKVGAWLLYYFFNYFRQITLIFAGFKDDLPFIKKFKLWPWQHEEIEKAIELEASSASSSIAEEWCEQKSLPIDRESLH
jgi:hypothetical protein